jgi:hypothetical protein
MRFVQDQAPAHPQAMQAVRTASSALHRITTDTTYHSFELGGDKRQKGAALTF